MSKAMKNWQRLPNSRMDRQHRPKAFFRQKERVEDFDRIEKKLQDRQEKQWDEVEEAKKVLSYIEKEEANGK